MTKDNDSLTPHLDCPCLDCIRHREDPIAAKSAYRQHQGHMLRMRTDFEKLRTITVFNVRVTDMTHEELLGAMSVLVEANRRYGVTAL